MFVKLCLNKRNFYIGDERDVDAKKAFESLLFITLTVPAGPQWDNFSTEVMQRAHRDYNFTYEEEVSMCIELTTNSIQIINSCIFSHKVCTFLIHTFSMPCFPQE